MLTGLNTYSSYWVYRGWLSKNDFDKYWWDDPEYKKKKFSRYEEKTTKNRKPSESDRKCI